MENSVDLIEAVDKQMVKIRTNSYDVSFNELYDMYQNHELVIQPEYQRLFRWDEAKQSRFIESLILEMPVPPIYVIETDTRIYELIDGLQRLSSYFHFRGDKIGDLNLKPLVLQGCDMVPALNGLTYKDLTLALQIKLKRSFIRMEVVRKESEPTLKYHMFKRLNTGGELLSDQEIRNCTIRILGSKAIDFINDCAQNEDFQAVIKSVGKNKIQAGYAQELALQFFALKNDVDNYHPSLLASDSEFLTKYLEKVTTGDVEFDYSSERQIFQDTFHYIHSWWDENIIFQFWVFDRDMEYNFISFAIALNLERIKEIEKVSPVSDKIIERIQIKLRLATQAINYSIIKDEIVEFAAEVKKILDGAGI